MSAAVLFTCAGQRVDIVSAFARAGATTIAVDVNALAPALYHADHRVLVPRIDDPGYLDAVRGLVAEHDVDLIVPLTDLDQHLLAAERDTLGAQVLLLGARGGRGDGRQVARRTGSSSSAASRRPTRGFRARCRPTPGSRCS